MIQNGYRVMWVAYSGLDYQIGDTTMDATEARKEAAAVIRARRRHGFTVTSISRGKAALRWEIQQKEQGGMVLDSEGYLVLHSPREFPCFECGCEFAPEEYSRTSYHRPTCGGCQEVLTYDDPSF